MPKEKFRYVEEARGSTLPLKDEVLHVGTYLLMTCVGVYFKIDDEKCFMAHMDARTPKVWPHMAVTQEAGEEIVVQVKRRLLDFFYVDKWDLGKPEFGKNLILQSPTFGDRIWNGERYLTPAKFVVRAVREFFIACARTLEEEVELRKKSSHSSKAQNTQSIAYDQETKRLAKKAEDLREAGITTEVDDEHHAFVINPKTDVIWELGEIPESGSRRIGREDLEGHVPNKIHGLEERDLICRFGVLEDDRTAFPKVKHSTGDDKETIISFLQKAREKHKHFGAGSDADAASKRLTMNLDETHVLNDPNQCLSHGT